MNARCQITVMDNRTDEMLKASMECEGFTIIAFHVDVKSVGIILSLYDDTYTQQIIGDLTEEAEKTHAQS